MVQYACLSKSTVWEACDGFLCRISKKVGINHIVRECYPEKEKKSTKPTNPKLMYNICLIYISCELTFANYDRKERNKQNLQMNKAA